MHISHPFIQSHLILPYLEGIDLANLYLTPLWRDEIREMVDLMKPKKRREVLFEIGMVSKHLDGVHLSGVDGLDLIWKVIKTYTPLTRRFTYWRDPTLKMKTYEEFFAWLWPHIRLFDRDKLMLAIARRRLDRLFPSIFAVTPFDMKTMKPVYLTVSGYASAERVERFLDFVPFNVENPQDHPLVVIGKGRWPSWTFARVLNHPKCKASPVPWFFYLLGRYNVFYQDWDEEKNWRWFRDSYFTKVPVDAIRGFLQALDIHKTRTKPWLIGKLRELCIRMGVLA